MDELAKWLSHLNLEHLDPILRKIGVTDIKFLSEVEESDLNGIEIKPNHMKVLLKEIQKLNSSSETLNALLHNNIHL